MKMSLIVLIALACASLLRGRSAAFRHWVIAAGIACAAAMPLLMSIVPSWTLPFTPPAAFAPYDPAASGAPAAPATVSRTNNPLRSATAQGAPIATSNRFTAESAMQFLWGIGAVIGLGVLAIGIVRLTWVASRAREITDGRWPSMAREISEAYGLKRSITLLQSDHPTLLVTWGLARPKVILPAAADAWSSERARVVLAHEIAHIHRGDWIVQLAAELLRAVYWFNPLLWIACRKLRLESEHACDDEVMKRGVDGTDYATHLIELARTLNSRRHTWFPAPAMARPSSLERRVRAMLNDRLDRTTINGASRALIFVLLFGIAAAVAAAQSAFVTFSGTTTDEQGRVVPGVAVTLSNDAREAKYQVKANRDGRFELVGLPPGDYRVEIEGKGFQGIREDVTLGPQNVRRDYTMSLGTLQETITLRFGPNDPTGDPRDTPVVSAEIPMPPRKECVAAVEGGRIIPPRKIRDVSPYYPSALRGTGTGGTVKMISRIGRDGYVADVRIVGDAQPDLAQSAVAAVREWRFTETLLNCTPVDVTMNVTVNFQPAPPPPPPAPRP